MLNAAALRRAKALSLAPAAPVAPKSAPAVKRKKDKVTKERVNILYILYVRCFFLGLDLNEIIYPQLGQHREGHPGLEAYEIWHCEFIDIRKYYPWPSGL